MADLDPYTQVRADPPGAGSPEPVVAGTRRLFNRELSWLDFNHRVLELAADPSLPLLERVRYCSIWANNLDEFFMVRVAGLVDHVLQGSVPGDGTPPQDTLDDIAERYRTGLVELEDLLHGDLLPALAREGIQVVSLDDLPADEREEIDTVFDEQLYPVLTPLAVGPGQPFPYISNLSLSVGITVRDPSTGETRFARVKVPEVLPRLIQVGQGTRFVRIDEVIAHGLPALFPGMEIVGASTFRVTRDADFEIKEGADDLLEAVERELSRRRFGDVVRLEIDEAMPADMRAMLIEALDVDLRQVFATRPPLDLSGLNVLTRVPRPDLRFSQWQPQVPERLVTKDDAPVDMFAEIRKGDILVHHPYESFTASVERFIEQAVADPDVLAIKHTIYRTSGDAPIVPALAVAAEEGKQAVALVEVTARFDEERNIRWARALERAGVHVVHGRVGLKTHCKLALVVRREGGRSRRYVHIGTGNYHPSTARAYTDFGLFTCDEEITADVADLFNQLTGFARPQGFHAIWVAPMHLRDQVVQEIRRCVREHTAAAPARITMKMNSLVDATIIEELYAASQAGVAVDLIVRGICCLRPGVQGMSETIRVISILGRFLEHARVFRFTTGVETRLLMGSADMMPRNLDNRIEVITPVRDAAIAERLSEALDLELADTGGSWELDAEGRWFRRSSDAGQDAIFAQEAFMARALRAEAATGQQRLMQREETAERIHRGRSSDG
ncbi:MAG: polyphosphate kinase 1 [Gaiellales bacterium]